MATYGEPGTNFALKVGVEDVGLIGDYDPRVYTGHRAIMDYVKDCVDFLPITQSATNWRFETTKNCDFYGRWWLAFDVAVATTGGTYKRLVDGFGLFCFERIEVRVGSNLLQTIYPGVDTFARYVKNLNNESRSKLYPPVGLGLPVALRTTLAQGTQRFCVPIDTWWWDAIEKQPIVCGIQQGLQVLVYLNPAATVVQTDGTAPTLTFTNVSLRTEETIVPEENRVMKVRSVMQPNQINYFFKQLVQLPAYIDVPIGTTSLENISLQGFIGPIYEFWFLCRRLADWSVDNQYDYTNLSEDYNFDSFDIRCNNQYLIRPFDVKSFIKPYTDERCYTGAGCPIIFISPSEDPESSDTATGHINLQFSTNATLALRWNTPTTETLRIQLNGRRYNWIQHTGGTLRTIFG